MEVQEFKDRLPQAAFAFRGYNLTNMGRNTEMLAHPVYGPIVEKYLKQASRACYEVTGHRPKLADRVRHGKETTLKQYSDAVAIIVAVEMAQLELLEKFFEISYKQAKICFGYSLGEISALVAGGTIEMGEALKIPLTLAQDCIELAKDVSLGILFSRGEELPLDEIRRLCLYINGEGRGVIGVSAYLSPNSLLLMGQGDTVDRFKSRIRETMPRSIHLRKNQGKYPPLHTPIVWEKFIPNRAAVLMHTLKGGFTAPDPPVLSLVTGNISYDDYNTRELIHRWTDQPQRLWDAVYETLTMGIKTVIHVGPKPNIIPATYQRLADNVEVQTKGRIHMHALTLATSHPWLKAVLPARTALLQAPQVEHVILEDWLLEQEIE